jgi:hypothetical protein
MKTLTPGKARDYAPGEEAYQGQAQRSIYRNGYAAGEAEADAGHNPHRGKNARVIWEAGRSRARSQTAAAGQ